MATLPQATLPPVMDRINDSNTRFRAVLARELAVQNDELVNDFVVEIGQPICVEDQNLCDAIMRLWRTLDPLKVRPEDFVDASGFPDMETFRKFLRRRPEYLRSAPGYSQAHRERNIRMCRWFDKCFPGHDRWEVLGLTRSKRKVRVKRKVSM